MLFKAFDCTPYGIARTASRADGADEPKVKSDGVEPERASVNRAKCRSRSCQRPYADQTKIRLMHMGRQDMSYNSSSAHSSVRLNPSFARTRQIPRSPVRLRTADSETVGYRGTSPCDFSCAVRPCSEAMPNLP
jgi:hypothetical protein